jgi:hypothetical protein
MLARFRPRLTFANVVSVLALFVALGGGAYAAATINGSSIKKNSIPGSRLKKDTVTGRKIKESSLGRVPSARNAANAQALGGQPRSSLGPGVVSGSLYKVPNGTGRVQPYGYFAFGSGDFFGIDAVAPVRLTVRDFVANVESLASGSVSFSLYVVSGAGVTSTPLCQVSSMVITCRAAGPITIPRDAHYRIQTDGTGVSANAAVGYQYRAAAG